MLVLELILYFCCPFVQCIPFKKYFTGMKTILSEYLLNVYLFGFANYFRIVMLVLIREMRVFPTGVQSSREP